MLGGAQAALSWTIITPQLLETFSSRKSEARQCKAGGEGLDGSSTVSATLQLLADCKDRVRIELSKQQSSGQASQGPGFTEDGDQPQQPRGVFTEILQDAGKLCLRLP